MEVKVLRVIAAIFMLVVIERSALGADLSAQEECLLKRLGEVSASTSVGALQEACAAIKSADASLVLDKGGEVSVVSARLNDERQSVDNPFAIIPHKPNYFLPATYNSSPNEAPFEGLDGTLENMEMKFQLSYKFPVAHDLFVKDSQLFFAYTGLSFWQAYNSKFSSPFRETNHEPEVFLLLPQHWQFLGWRAQVLALGLNHQSNGQTGLLSRSWNRIYATLVMERKGWVVSLKPWYRIPEDEKEDITDSAGDDNPDIDDYLGHGEFGLFYKKGENTYSMMLRNNFKEENRGAVEVAWSFPIGSRYGGRLKGYVKYFNGYGESLIDYNSSVNRIGVGIAINDWL